MARIKTLVSGYKKFYNQFFVKDNPLYKNLQDGQQPKTMVISCSDSRVNPSLLLSVNPGDIFVVRNVANLVPEYSFSNYPQHLSAALEFAVLVLEVENILIIGHSNCGGIKALMESKEQKENPSQDFSFIDNWVSIAKDVKEEASSCEDCEKKSIIRSLDRLMTYPWIKERVEKKKLTLHGWYFSIKDGSLKAYNPRRKKFEPLEQEDEDI